MEMTVAHYDEDDGWVCQFRWLWIMKSAIEKLYYGYCGGRDAVQWVWRQQRHGRDELQQWCERKRREMVEKVADGYILRYTVWWEYRHDTFNKKRDVGKDGIRYSDVDVGQLIQQQRRYSREAVWWGQQNRRRVTSTGADEGGIIYMVWWGWRR